VKIGDHVIISGAEGDVVEIGMRGTTLKTAQRSLVIVPNQSFITGNVVNWDEGGNSVMIIQIRMMGKVNEDIELLLTILRASPDILQTPPPSAFVTAIDHNGHTMEAHFWLSGDAEHRLKILSYVNVAVLNELERRGQVLAP
jgi:potassium-dependent mechanosensitive channel